MKFLVFLLLVFESSIVSARNILISGPEISPSVFQGLTQEAEGETYAELILKKSRREARDQGFRKRAIELRRAELQKDLDGIGLVCGEVLEERLKQEWPREERQLIGRCLKHMALLQSDKRLQNAYLKEAKWFLGSSDKADRLPEKLSENFELAVINGKKIDFNYSTVLPTGVFRLRLISNRYRDEVHLIHKDELVRLPLKLRPLINGTCQGGFRYEGTSLEASEVDRLMVLDEKCQVSLLESLPPSPPPITQNFQRSTKSNFSFNKKRWLWLGLGGLVTWGLLQSHKNSKDKASGPPSRRTGF